MLIPFQDPTLAKRVAAAFHDAIIQSGGRRSSKDIY
jgi:hypothetical protein